MVNKTKRPSESVPSPRALRKPVPAKSVSIARVLNKLGRVLDQSEDIKASVEQAASELASVNEALKREGTLEPSAQTIKAAIVQNEEVEQKVTKAADDLHEVNAAIAREVAERVVIESELADTRSDLADTRDDLATSRVKEEDTRLISLRDALTGLANRVLLEERLAHGLIQATRHAWGLAVLFIDIDKFKSINDSYGHDVGDKVLVTVADRLQASVRGEDTVCRWGGDEFVCLLLDIKHDGDGERIAEKMAARISEACDFGGGVLSLRASIGVAVYPRDGNTIDVLLKNADRAMYRAKGTQALRPLPLNGPRVSASGSRSSAGESEHAGR